MLLWKNGVHILVELKMLGKQLSDHQRKWWTKIEDAGFQYFIVYDLEQFEKVLNKEGLI